METPVASNFVILLCSDTDPFDSIPGMKGELLALVLGEYPEQPLLDLKAESQFGNKVEHNSWASGHPLENAIM